jgi:hypothetical protein
MPPVELVNRLSSDAKKACKVAEKTERRQARRASSAANATERELATVVQ